MAEYYVTLNSGVVSNPGTWAPPWGGTATWYGAYTGSGTHNTTLNTTQTDLHNDVIDGSGALDLGDIDNRPTGIGSPTYHSQFTTVIEPKTNWVSSGTSYIAEVHDYVYASTLVAGGLVQMSSIEGRCGAAQSRPFEWRQTPIATNDVEASTDVIFDAASGGTVTFAQANYNAAVSAVTTALANISGNPIAALSARAYASIQMYKHADGWWRIWWDTDPPDVTITVNYNGSNSLNYTWTTTGTTTNYYISALWRPTATSYGNYNLGGWYALSAGTSGAPVDPGVALTNSMFILARYNSSTSTYWPVRIYYKDGIDV